ncbi:MAG: SdiA-regulated domain-containing protein [Burkholderiaceae bacterium]
MQANAPKTPTTLQALGRRIGVLAGSLLLLAILVLCWQLQVLPLAWDWLLRPDRPAAPPSTALSLADYRVTIEARPIEGIGDNASGLTYNPETGTLFVVINRPAAVAEVSSEGRLMRLMPLDGVRDPEDIAHVGGDLFLVGDERQNRVHWLHIGPDAARLSVAGQPSLQLPAVTLRNHGIEGVAWDPTHQRLYVSQEIWPRKLWAIDGLRADGPAPGSQQVADWHPAGGGMVPLGDYSALAVHEASGQLLVLSKLTGMALAYTPDGQLAGMLPLWPGLRGLQRRVPQPEGMAFDDRRRLYLVSEPNLLYRFEPLPPAR